MALASINERYDAFCADAEDLLKSAGLLQNEEPRIVGKALLEACNRLADIHFPDDTQVNGKGPRGLIWSMYPAVTSSLIELPDPDPVNGARSIAETLKNIMKHRPALDPQEEPLSSTDDVAESITYTCFHCGNETPHARVATHTGTHLYEQIQEQDYREPFDYFVYTCGTCDGMTILGGFRHELHDDVSKYPRLFPRGPSIVPPPHMLGSNTPIPTKIVRVYEDAWPLRRKNPNAFANQIRRALEFICDDKDAHGSNLFNKLRDLADRRVFPETLAEVATQIRLVGNVGSHASEDDVDIWDAELLDEFFRMLLDYVYLLPSKLERMTQRLRRPAI